MLVLNPYIKRDGCANNPEKHIITKIGEHIPSSKSTIWAFNHKENKHALYCRKYSRKNFCSSLREHATNILAINATINKRRVKITSIRKKMLYFIERES